MYGVGVVACWLRQLSHKDKCSVVGCFSRGPTSTTSLKASLQPKHPSCFPPVYSLLLLHPPHPPPPPLILMTPSYPRAPPPPPPPDPTGGAVGLEPRGGARRVDRQALERAWLDELSATYGEREAAIRRQYAAACRALAPAGGRAPGHAPDHAHARAREFRQAFEREKSELGLEVLYRGVVAGGRGLVFGRPLLEVHRELCGGSRVAMETRCAHLLGVLGMGLAALAAYTAVTEDDLEQVARKWAPRVEEVRARVEDVLRACS
ncbi:unnamed protein product [Arctogadus glacialis]